MQTKLYVSNLSQAATSSNLRQLFSACGDVLEVQLLSERASSTPSAAYVTMATAAAATRAVERLHGELFHGRSLMVSAGLGEKGNEAPAAAARPKSVGVTITQQYRDRHGMTYELDWVGRRLTFQFFFPTDDPNWRIQARTGTSADDVVEAAAATRELALHAVAKASQSVSSLSGGGVPWDEVTAALKSVRAI